MSMLPHLEKQKQRGAYIVSNAILNPPEDAPILNKDDLCSNIAVALANHILAKEYDCFFELTALLHSALAAMPAVND